MAARPARAPRTLEGRIGVKEILAIGDTVRHLSDPHGRPAGKVVQPADQHGLGHGRVGTRPPGVSARVRGETNGDDRRAVRSRAWLRFFEGRDRGDQARQKEDVVSDDPNELDDEAFLELLESLPDTNLDRIRARVWAAERERIHEYKPSELQQLLDDARTLLGVLDAQREAIGIIQGPYAARRGQPHELESPDVCAGGDRSCRSRGTAASNARSTAPTPSRAEQPRPRSSRH
jgi:hypothetical protein